MATLKISDIVPAFNSPMLRWCAPFAEYLVAISVFNQFAHAVQNAEHDDVYSIADQAMKHYGFNLVVEPSSIENIPASGAVILASEHPTDLADHAVIMHTLGQVRRDYKFIANSEATKLKFWNDILLPLSLHGEKNAAATNTAALRHGIQWLNQQHSLITYPGARPSTLSQRVRRGREYWSALPILLAEKTGAVILPVNLRLAEPKWQLFLKKHCRPLYNLLAFHILNSLKNTKTYITIGSPIRYEDLPKELTREQQAQWLRKQAMALGK